ncbi:hypothetical protein GCM10022271_23440 [Corallibacter vietnamensis]|uniref:YcxB-like protein domain-containing protein n=1 Tax=Corallibacter vietnamensis TaxID=904130 RepID=A0ABP7HDZ8_9FLAO
MNKIELNVASRGLYLLHYLGSPILAAIATIPLFKLFDDLNKLSFIVIYGGVWYITSRFTKKIPNGQVELEMKEDGIQVNWQKQFLLHNKSDQLIKWQNIKDYMFQPEQYFDLLRIRTKDKKKYKFSMIGENNDFPFFYEKLEETIKSKSTDDSIEIKRAKNIYESNYGLISAIFMGLVIIAVVIAFIFIEPKGNSSPNYGLLVASLAGGIFFIIQVISYRKKNKNDS